MSIQWPGGIITPTPATPSGPFQNGSAPGIWTLDQAAFWQKQGLWPIAGNVAPTGLFFRVGAESRVNTINKISIATTGNSTAFGALTNAFGYSGSCSSSTRWLCAGGENSSGNVQNSILYGNFTTSGTTGTFGALDVSKSLFAGLSNETRGLFAGGFDGSSPMCSISYVTIATTGNSTNFGNLTNQIRFNGGLASTTRGVSGGGASTTNVIGYVTIATTGNATSFGQLTVARASLGSCSNSTRGLFAGGESSSSGYPGVNTIDYITIATTGNATAFGSLTVARGTYGNGGWGLASTTRGVFGGAYDFNNIDYVTIASTGNATDFGDLNGTSAVGATASNSHGGL
jgi:hypothetical protein